MTAIDAARIVYTQHQVHLMRPKKNAPGYDLKEAFSGKKKGWFYLDGFTASAICKVYDAVNDANKAKLEKLPVEKLARICFSVIK